MCYRRMHVMVSRVYTIDNLQMHFLVRGKHPEWEGKNQLLLSQITPFMPC